MGEMRKVVVWVALGVLSLLSVHAEHALPEQSEVAALESGDLGEGIGPEDMMPDSTFVGHPDYFNRLTQERESKDNDERAEKQKSGGSYSYEGTLYSSES